MVWYLIKDRNKITIFLLQSLLPFYLKWNVGYVHSYIKYSIQPDQLYILLQVW
jgi:hypothetical protein